MKDIILRLVFLLLPFYGITQKKNLDTSSSSGIQFERPLHWQQVIDKAKRENKFIFLDCYTTWCVPCKKMENEIYPIKEVGDYYNANFICIKYQMDTSVDDNAEIKSLYADAHYVFKQFNVNVFPSYLFFDTEGRILNRFEGLRAKDNFIEIAKDVLDEKRNYYKILESFDNGERDPVKMAVLARTALLLGDTSTYQEVGHEYIAYLRNDVMFSKDNIEFLAQLTQSSKDKGFTFFLKHADSVNIIMNTDGYAQQLIQSIIYKEIVVPLLPQDGLKKTFANPQWTLISSAIKKKYGFYYADRVTTNAKVIWAARHGNWSEYSKNLVKYVETYCPKKGQMVDFILNNYAWAIFRRSVNPQELERALLWSAKAIMMNPIPNWMDTYANILYKLGRTEEAIRWEEIATKLDPSDKDIETMLQMMKQGKQTWPSN